MLPIFFVLFAGASMGAQETGQEVGYAGCQAADDDGLHGAAQCAGSRQTAFDSTKKQERRQGDGHRGGESRGYGFGWSCKEAVG